LKERKNLTVQPFKKKLNSVKKLICDWLGFSSVDRLENSNHCIKFAHSVGWSIVWCSLMHLILFSWAWVLWNERNNMIVNNKEKTNPLASR